MIVPARGAAPEADAPISQKYVRVAVGVGWMLTLGFVVHTAVRGGVGPHVRAFQLFYLFGCAGYLAIVHTISRVTTEALLGDWRCWLSGMFALRVVMIGAAPSDDVWRYAWEGRIQAAGFNPYRVAPNDESLSGLRDKGWEKINHPDYPAIYPPLAQIEFRLAASVYDPVRSIKVLHVLWDVLTVVVLARMLHRAGKVRHMAAVYGLCPLVLTAFGVEGHVDSLMVLLAMSALDAEQRGRSHLAGILLGLSMASKLMTLVILPWFLWRRTRSGLLALVVFASSYVPYLDAGASLLHSLTRFGSAGMFFSLPGTVSYLAGGFEVPSVFLFVLLCVMLVFFLTRCSSSVAYTGGAFGALICLLPTIHYWYFTWCMAFQVFRPRLPYLVATLALVVYFEAAQVRATTGDWIMPVWCPEVFWAALSLAWAGDTIAGQIKHRTVGRDPGDRRSA